ncbi:MAG: hypothetical protein Fur0041_10700 [Bacteroidia bacterium]
MIQLRHIPNILSAWRLLTFPVLLFLIYREEKSLFILLLSVNLITDILDGLLARTFRWATEFGARLDSLADISTYVAVFIAMIAMEQEFIKEKSVEFLLLISFWIIPVLISLFRFKKVPSFHLYSYKIAGYFQGIFIFTYFNWGNDDRYFYIMLAVSMLAFIEELIVVVKIPELRSNVKGIYFMVKEKGGIR